MSVRSASNRKPEPLIVHIGPQVLGWRQLDLAIQVGFVPEISRSRSVLCVGCDKRPESEFCRGRLGLRYRG